MQTIIKLWAATLVDSYIPFLLKTFVKQRFSFGWELLNEWLCVHDTILFNSWRDIKRVSSNKCIVCGRRNYHKKCIFRSKNVGYTPNDLTAHAFSTYFLTKKSSKAHKFNKLCDSPWL